MYIALLLQMLDELIEQKKAIKEKEAHIAYLEGFIYSLHNSRED